MIRVLFVDDEMIVRVALKSMVEWENTEFEIVGAVADAEAALENLEQYHPQIIVTDLKMPNLDGLGLVKLLAERGYDGKIIILSGYGEFEYAREALRYGVVDYLLKASFNGDDLVNALRHAAKSLPKSAPEPNFHAENEFTPAQVQRLFFDKEDPEPQQYKVRWLAVYLFQESIFSNVQELEEEKARQALATIAGECVGLRDGVTVVSLSDKNAVLFYPVSTANSNITDSVKRDCKKISDSVQIYMNTQVGFVLSSSFSNSLELHRNLRICSDASRLCLYRGFGTLIHQEELAAYTNPIGKDVFAPVEKDFDALITSNYNEARQAAFAVLDGFNSGRVDPLEAQRCIKILFQRINIAYCFYFKNDQKKSPDFMMRYEKCRTITEYKTLCSDIIDEISVSPIKIAETHYRKEVLTIINYIRSNIDKKITLTQLSDAVNMTESYISRLFKNETNISLMSYVNMLKMEHAMKLLKNPDTFVKQVASALGYDDQSYFNRVFNRYVGMSPIEFKRNYQNGSPV